MDLRHHKFKGGIDAFVEVQQICSCKSSFPTYICSSCHTLFCHNCAKLVGIPSSCLCKVCGSLCSDYKKFVQKQSALADKAAPFGSEDFKSALRYPFQEFYTNSGLALIYGALLYSVPYLGFSGPGVLFGVLGIIPALIANSLLFSFNLRVINAVETRRLSSKNVLDTTEIIADLGETVALCCGILFITVMPYLVSSLLMRGIVSRLALCWMIFYYPLALMVAASSKSFWATINPASGLEEIQLHKSVYPKFFFFYILICVTVGALVLTVLAKFLQSISGSPTLALLPIFIVLMMVLGSLIFYSNLVLSYLIGRMRFKESY